MAVVVLAGAPASAATTTSTTATPATAPSAATSSWTVYHGDPVGDGDAGSVTSVSLTTPAWTSPALDGALYGEPLVSSGRVYVATETDTVYALSASTGAVAWSTHVGTPVPSSVLPCGDISPTVGVTGTPVIDPARSEVFVVADELVKGAPAHEMIGLDTATGRVELTQDVDPPGSTPSALLQRTGLTLDANRIVFGYGGNFGDCSTYHGWVESVPEAGGAADYFQVDSRPGESQGAVWMGGAAPVVDAGGNIWVEAGNGSVKSSSAPYDDSDSVLELSSALALMQYFAPTTWASENATDFDLSTAPALLSDGQVVAAGKDRTAYLLDGAHLGGIGGEQSSLPGACGDVIDGGAAVVGTTVYLPCLQGPVALQVSSAPAGLRVLWRSSAGGGPPIVAAGLVWTIGQDGVLYGLSPTTGAVVRHVTVGPPANHFPTPSVGAGLLLAPGSDRVVAFRATSNSPAPSTTTTTHPTTTTSTHAPKTTPPPSSGGLPAWAIALIVLGAVALAGLVVWWVRRRRSAAHPPV
jgi:outer membrane protein assembly factor BamB